MGQVRPQTPEAPPLRRPRLGCLWLCCEQEGRHGSRPGRGLVPALEHLDEHAHRLLLGRVALGLVEQCEVRVRVRVLGLANPNLDPNPDPNPNPNPSPSPSPNPNLQRGEAAVQVAGGLERDRLLIQATSRLIGARARDRVRVRGRGRDTDTVRGRGRIRVRVRVRAMGSVPGAGSPILRRGRPRPCLRRRSAGATPA